MTYVTSSELTVAAFYMLRVFFPPAHDHSARESRSRSALVSNTHLILAQGYRWHGLPPVCRRPVSARLEPVRTSVQLSLVQLARHEVSSWRLPVAYVRSGMPAFLRRIQVGVVPDDRNIQLERLILEVKQ
jgi:hypothetical protein